jgi:ATP-dependent exoDNAse (exonuclease V) alpha subunit
MTQDQALAILDSGVSVLLTGAAGTGKTYALQQFINQARSKGKSVAVTATTGLAATHLNGTTIHAWSGIGVHDTIDKKLLTRLPQSRKDLIRKADILVIDEISMLHDYRLDMVEEVTRTIRESDKSFGGLQVVLCGDFYQLPPVNRGDGREGGFITDSDAWKNKSFTTCYLEEYFRQADDEVYRDILNGIRAGVLSGRQIGMLKDKINEFDDPFDRATRLLTTNVDVDRINEEYLLRIEGDTHVFEMQTTGSKNYVEQLKRACLAQETLALKVGAQVMFIKNSSDKKYVNGTLGIVSGFSSTTGMPEITLRSGRVIEAKVETWELTDGDKKRASLLQLPLRLAWAITVHKSQGMTLDAARIDLRRAFVEGMGYVALSRVRGLEHLSLDGINGMALQVSKQAKDIDQDLRKSSNDAVTEHAETFKKWKKSQKNKKPPEPKADGPWAQKVEKMRKTYPNAYRPWSKNDDEKLRKMFLDGSTVEDLSDEFGRHVGAVSIRLQKQFGDNVTLTHRKKHKK